MTSTAAPDKTTRRLTPSSFATVTRFRIPCSESDNLDRIIAPRTDRRDHGLRPQERLLHHVPRTDVADDRTDARLRRRVTGEARYLGTRRDRGAHHEAADPTCPADHRNLHCGRARNEM
ncbi:MAG: hypothetical protein WKF78_00085 [Candidatus Limnocylindrales bacterium]